MKLSNDTYDCIVTSDLHLGSHDCNSSALLEFLRWALCHCRTLVLNGDIFDSLNFHRLNKEHFDCLRELRKHSDHCQIIWVRGNHDGQCDLVSHILGVTVFESYLYRQHGVRLLCIHGDQFDDFMWGKVAILTKALDIVFHLTQAVFPSAATRWIRAVSKNFQRNSSHVRQRALDYGRHHGANMVTCGHTHLPEEIEGRYFNTGTWAEYPPYHFVAVKAGNVELRLWPLLQDADGAADGPNNAGDHRGDHTPLESVALRPGAAEGVDGGI